MKIGMKRTKGLDIDASLAWRGNDSLKAIPSLKTGIIITNPPYLTNYSAKRKGVGGDVDRYFATSLHDDLYKIALERCLEAAEHVVAIIPETFINSTFPKSRLASVTILEMNPFEDTDVPVCVACFDGKSKPLSGVRVYKNDAYLGRLSRLEKKRLTPSKALPMKFNAPDGQIALRAVDQVGADGAIRFMRPEDLDYDLDRIGQTSRLITRIEIGGDIGDLDAFIAACNEFLERYRIETADVLFSPFK